MSSLRRKSVGTPFLDTRRALHECNYIFIWTTWNRKRTNFVKYEEHMASTSTPFVMPSFNKDARCEYFFKNKYSHRQFSSFATLCSRNADFVTAPPFASELMSIRKRMARAQRNQKSVLAARRCAASLSSPFPQKRVRRGQHHTNIYETPVSTF